MPSASEVVTQHPLFSHLDPADMRRVLEVGDVHVFDVNTPLFEQGEKPSRVFIILRGTVSQSARPGTAFSAIAARIALNPCACPPLAEPCLYKQPGTLIECLLTA